MFKGIITTVLTSYHYLPIALYYYYLKILSIFFFSVAVSVKQRTRCSECGAAIAVTMLDGFPPSAKIESEGDSHRTG